MHSQPLTKVRLLRCAKALSNVLYCCACLLLILCWRTRFCDSRLVAIPAPSDEFSIVVRGGSLNIVVARSETGAPIDCTVIDLVPVHRHYNRLLLAQVSWADGSHYNLLYRLSQRGWGYLSEELKDDQDLGPAIADRHKRLASVTALTIPSWFPLSAMLAVPPISLIGRWRRRRLNRDPQICPQCRYDLRASPHRCPECGAVNTGKLSRSRKL